MPGPCGFEQLQVSGHPDALGNGVYTYNAGTTVYVNVNNFTLFQSGDDEFAGAMDIDGGVDGEGNPVRLSTYPGNLWPYGTCPTEASGLLWSNRFSYSEPVVITITQYVEPVDPYAPWGGVQNWLRLRLLEYV
jgi:hypothetical protein